MDTPVLFLIYNRPRYTKEVFESIRKAKPKKLFIHADGPKKDNLNDIELCEQTRGIVGTIDWDCEVKTLFRDENLGCKLGMSGGISWFFENIEEGIILEDDCLPNQSFFRYCEALLQKYRNNESVMMISGSNPSTCVDIDADYFFSYFYHIWGWATWRRSWQKFDINISTWPNFRNSDFLEKKFPTNTSNRIFLKQMFDQIYDRPASVWGVQWTYTCLTNNGFAILPACNMISNIGFVGTHKMNDKQLTLETKEMKIDTLRHPNKIEVNLAIEDRLFESSGLKALINKE
jgi:hypothetical protein